LLAREALANEVELVERAVVDADIAAALAVADLDPEAEQVAQLPFESFKVGIDGPASGPFGRPTDIMTRPRPNFLCQMLRLPNRQIALDDFIG
jgi:hypothetical protein